MRLWPQAAAYGLIASRTRSSTSAWGEGASRPARTACYWAGRNWLSMFSGRVQADRLSSSRATAAFTVGSAQ